MKKYILKLIDLVIPLFVLFIVWEIIGRLAIFSSIVASPVSIIHYISDNSALFIRPTLRTVGYALAAGSFGSVIGCFCALLLVKFRRISNWFQGLLVCIFSAPLAALALLLAPAVGEETSGLILGSILSFFPSFITIQIGLLSIAKTPKAFLEASGASELQILKYLRVPSSIPALLHSFRLAIVGGFLGVMLSEYGQGSAGLGHLLRASIVSTNVLQQWSIPVIIVTLAIFGYLCVGVMKAYVHGRGYYIESDSIIFRFPYQTKLIARPRFWISRAAHSFVKFLIIILFWESIAFLCDLPNLGQAWQSLRMMMNIQGGSELGSIFAHVLAACGLAFAALIAAIVIGFSTAAVFFLFPKARQAMIPVMLVFQVTPIVAFVPLVLLALGHSQWTILLIAVSAIFYRVFEIMDFSMREIPAEWVAFFAVSGSPRITTLRKLAIPIARSEFFPSVRAAFPMALQGVVLGQYIISYDGLGGFLGRSIIHPNLIWATCVLVAILSFFLHEFLSIIEDTRNANNWSAAT